MIELEPSLPLKSLGAFVPNEFRQILKEGIPLQEKLMAIYCRAMKPDCFNFYKLRFIPSPPTGWEEEYRAYKEAEPKEKVTIWREMMGKFSHYLEAKQKAISENASDLFFLEEMKSFFEKMNMQVEADKCRQRIHQFKNPITGF